MIAGSDAVYGENLDIDSFRLLKIETGCESGSVGSGGDSILRCQLTTYSLDQAPAFSALSYAWHEPQSVQAQAEAGLPLDPADSAVESRQNCILLNGKETPVTPNLHSALHELCKHTNHDTTPSGSSYWWIDAICINQLSTAERTSQVSIMHQIYRNASTVCVWLGSDPNNEAYAVREFFRALLGKYVDADLDAMNGEGSKYQHGWLFHGDEATLLVEGLPHRFHPMWKSVVRFWERAWFSRVWVKQEVAVAAEGCVRMWCGTTDFTVEELVEVSRFHIWSRLAESLMIFKSDFQMNGSTSRKVGASAVGLQDLRSFVRWGNDFREADDFKQAADRLCGAKSEPAEEEEEVDGQVEGNEQHPLLRILAVELFITRRDDATDPRDKVFALLVLMRQIAENKNLPEVPVRIDYSKSKEEVYREAVSWIIQESGCLGVLCLLQPDRSMSKVARGWPSWVADFTCPPPQMLRLFESDPSCQTDKVWSNAYSHLRPSFKTPTNLEVYAKLIGHVGDIGDSSDSMIIDGCFELTARLLLNCPATTQSPDSRNLINSIDLWRRTMCGKSFHTNDDDDPILDTSRAAFKEWLVWLIIRKINDDFYHGLIQRGREHLAKMPSFELLAETDESDPKTLPDFGFWQTFYMDLELQRKYLTDHTPRFQHIEISGRRLFRIATCGSTATASDPLRILGIGPEGMERGDEVWVVAGCVMPVVLRRSPTGPRSGGGEGDDPKTRLVVGEAYVNDLREVLLHSGILPSDWQILKLR